MNTNKSMPPPNVTLKGLVTNREVMPYMVRITITIRQKTSPKDFKDLEIHVLCKRADFEPFRFNKWISVSGELRSKNTSSGYSYYVIAKQIGNYGNHNFYEELGGEARFKGQAICRVSHPFLQDDERDNFLSGKIVNFEAEDGTKFNAVALRKYSNIKLEDGEKFEIEAKLMPPKNEDLLPYFTLKKAEKISPFVSVAKEAM